MAKAVKTAAKKTATKKTSSKTTTAKKTAVKKTSSKRAAPKKTAAKKSAGKRAAPKKAAAKKTNKLGVKNSLVNNINAKKKKGTSKSAKSSTVDKESYKKMEDNWGKKK